MYRKVQIDEREIPGFIEGAIRQCIGPATVDDIKATLANKFGVEATEDEIKMALTRMEMGGNITSSKGGKYSVRGS